MLRMIVVLLRGTCGSNRGTYGKGLETATRSFVVSVFSMSAQRALANVADWIVRRIDYGIAAIKEWCGREDTFIRTEILSGTSITS